MAKNRYLTRKANKLLQQLLKNIFDYPLLKMFDKVNQEISKTLKERVSDFVFFLKKI